MTFTATFVVPARCSCHFRTLKSFFLLTYLLIPQVSSIF